MPEDVILELRKRHRHAIQKPDYSRMIRKGYEIRDASEPSGRRMLTDEEIAAITDPEPPKNSPPCPLCGAHPSDTRCNLEPEQESGEPALPSTPLHWFGDPLDSSPPASAIIEADSESAAALHETEVAELDAFYSGDQWRRELVAIRMNQNRPCLVLNKLPRLVAMAITANQELISTNHIRLLRRIITMRNMDAQRAYNIMASNAAEIQALELEQAKFRAEIEKMGGGL